MYHASAIDISRVLVTKTGAVVRTKSLKQVSYSKTPCKTQSKNNRFFDSTAVVTRLMEGAYTAIEQEKQEKQKQVKRMTRTQKRKLGIV